MHNSSCPFIIFCKSFNFTGEYNTSGCLVKQIFVTAFFPSGVKKTAEKLSLKIVFTIFYPFPARSLPPLKGCHHFQIATYKKDL